MARKIKGKRSQIKAKSFNCGSCGSPVKINIQGHTLNVVCPSCQAIIDAKDPNFQVLQKVTSQIKYTPYIPLNARGKLKGRLWECTGFIVKSDSGFYWREYLLYNPYHGYRWLVEADGHWTLYKKIYRAVETQSQESVSYKNKNFKMFNNGVSTVRYVEGEFYWRIKLGDTAKVKDFIAPPEGLSVEEGEYEENWSLGYSISGETIKKAFRIKHPEPLAVGIGMLQESPLKERLQANMKPLITSLMVLFAIFVIRGITASNKIVFSRSYSPSEFPNSKSVLKTEEFEIPGGTTNVEITGNAKVYNSWVYIDALLVDSTTQQGVPLPVEVSYYRGSDWSEGGQSKSRIANNIPPGQYFLSLKYQQGPTPPQGYIDVILKRDVPISSNFILAVILILIGPILSFLRSRSFEMKRWSNSDYSPYHQE